jgi:hypothetical protein
MKTVMLNMLVILGICLLITSCIRDLEEQVDASVNDLKSSIKGIDANAANIVNILNGLKEKNYPEVIKDIINNDVDQLLKTTISTGGVEFRCNTDFLRNRIRAGLGNTVNRLRNLIRSKKNQKLLPLSYIPPTFCNCVPVLVDLNAPRSKSIKIFGYSFDNADSIHVFILKKDGQRREISDRLTKSSDYILVLGTDTISKVANSDKVEVYFKNKNIYSFLVVSKSPKICSERDFSFPPTPNTYEITAQGCGGDDEFAGAVFIECSGTLTLSADQKSVICNLHFKADEKDGDTHACFDKSFNVFTAEEGFKIKNILTATSFEYKYINNREEADSFNGSGFVDHASLRGDHHGGDVGTWTGASLWFNNIRVTLIEDGDCVPKETIIKESVL